MWLYAAAWGMLLVIFVVVELATESLTSIWFAGGALVSVILALLQCGILWQCAAFLVVSVLLLAATRPVVKKMLAKKKVATNADALIGMEGLVTVSVDNLRHTGRVKVNGLDWAAQSYDGIFLAEGSAVAVKEIRGATLMVSLLN